MHKNDYILSLSIEIDMIPEILKTRADFHLKRYGIEFFLYKDFLFLGDLLTGLKR